jgi:outer membrane protein assembly factor BamD
MRNRRLKIIIWILCGTVFLIAIGMGCNKERMNLGRRSAEEHYEDAKRLFDKKKYYKAKLEFRLLVLNNQGSLIIEKAQFYLAETHFKMKEYILAVEEYEKLIRSLPRSQYVDDARYKIGMSYFKLSPHYALDQDYSNKAIMQFRQFMEEYPDSELRPEVEQKLNDSVNKLAKKEYMTGDLYRKMNQPKAAVISFNSVLDKYADTEFAELALYWKSECHRRLNEFDEAEMQFKDFIRRHPKSDLIPKAEEKLKEIETDKGKMSKEASGSNTL